MMVVTMVDSWALTETEIPIHVVTLPTKPVYVLNSKPIWFLDDMKQMSAGISYPQVEEWEHVYRVPLGLRFTVGRKKSC